MARELKLLFALWVVVACLGGATAVAEPITQSATTTPTEPTTQSATTTPTEPTTQSATTTPTEPTTQSATTTPTEPTTQSATTTPTEPTTQSATTTPTEPTTQSATTTPAEPTTQSATTTATEPTTQSATTTPTEPTTQSATTTPAEPTTQSATTTPTEPTTQSATTTPAEPTTQSATTTPAEPTTQSATTTVAGSTTPSVTPVTPDSPATTRTPATTTTPVPQTTKLPGPCDGEPCADRSTCEARSNHTYKCFCLAGDSYDYDIKRCLSAKIFPGLLDLPDLKYDESMLDKTSPAFQEASSRITGELDKAFNSSGGFSQVVKLSEMSSERSKVWLMSNDGGVRATVDFIFKTNANIDSAEVKELLKKATECKDCLLQNSSFTASELCDQKPCDEDTSECQPLDGSYNCTCLADYIETDFSNRICIACPSGEEATGSKGSKSCVECSFGYSGLNCKESWQLVLAIVGPLLGGMLLITLILLPVLALKSKKSSKKDKHADMGKPYVSYPPAKQPLVNSNFAKSPAASFNGPANGLSAFANAGVPRIPRATTTNSWDSRTNLEMTLSNSRQNLIPVGRNSRLYDDHDDMNQNAQARPQSGLYAQARPQNNPYAQNQPQNNPYAQNQPQNNPYAQSQGNSNPYYTHDNGRRLN